MVFFLNIVYERLFAFPGLTPSGYYGGMIFAESAEDVLGFILYISYQRLFAFRGPTRSGYYGGMILDESPEDFHGFLFVHCL